MFTVRREQMRAFEKSFENRFLRQAMSDLTAEMPVACEKLGSDGLRALVESTLVKCDRYRISDRELLLRFATLQIRLGKDFDISPAHPWARPILLNASRTQGERMDGLELESFICAALAFLREQHPEILEEHGESGFRTAIAEAHSRCLRYGIDIHSHGLRFLWLTCLLGRDFDSNPEKPWAAKILEDGSLDSEKKIRQLEEAAGLSVEPIGNIEE
jgi:hypothetical protein